MPKLVQVLRQRERTIDRVWSYIQPELLVYNIGGTIYTRTYPHIDVQWNKLESGVDPIPFGFRFNPDPDPPLVAISGVTGINLEPIQSLFSQNQNPPSNLTVPPNLQNQPPQPAQQNIIRILPTTIPCGTTSTPLSQNSILVRRVTILADQAVVDKIWISSQKGSSAGVGFPLIAGSAKDIGDVTLTDKFVDLSTIYIIGTNSNDKAYIFPEV